MLEPTGTPEQLWEHHKAQASLCRAAGDHPGAYWHGRKAQKARKAMLQDEHQEALNRGRLSTVPASQALLELAA